MENALKRLPLYAMFKNVVYFELAFFSMLDIINL